jgi:hypothetical protein
MLIRGGEFMILRNIKNNKLYDSKYSIEDDEYIIYDGSYMVRTLKPCAFRTLIHDNFEKEYIIEKDD